MPNYKIVGSTGENEVVELIPCPNCSNHLMLLPASYPLNDVQCVACNFRSQVKTSNFSPLTNKIIPGAGWDIMDKVMKAGFLIPPLIVNFKWIENGAERQEIRFYPFVKKSNLKKRTAQIVSKGRIYNMFDYDLGDLPFMVMYKK